MPRKSYDKMTSGQKAAHTRKWRAAGQKAAVTRKQNAVGAQVSGAMTTAQLTRALRILHLTDGRRDLGAERAAMRKRLQGLAAQGKVKKSGRAGWKAVYR